MDEEKLPNVKSFYTLVSGYLRLASASTNEKSKFDDWLERVPDNLKLYKYLNSVYYDNYLDKIIGDTAEHLTHKPTLHSPESIKIFEIPDMEFQLSYFDIYRFPEGHTLFTFKLQSNEAVSLQTIISINSILKNPSSKIEFRGIIITIKELAFQYLSAYSVLEEQWDAYIPQLKLYSIIDLDEPSISPSDLKRWLFELGTQMNPVGNEDSHEMAAAEDFYNNITNNHVLQIYQNWGMISLFDSMVRISCDYEDEYLTWENDYFLIYIHVLHMKFYLFTINTKLNNVTTVSKENEKLKNRFIDFENDNNFSFISYKFLPNALLQEIKKGLYIDQELKEIEEKIKYLNEATEQRKSRNLNSLLLIISFLSVISVINDLSEWLVNLGVSKTLMFTHFLSLGIGLTILVSLFLVIRKLN